MSKLFWIAGLGLLFTTVTADWVVGSTFNSSQNPGTIRSSGDSCPEVQACLKRLDEGEDCDLLPVPEHAVLPAVPPGSFLLTEVRKGVFAYNDGAYITLILRSGTHLVVIDVPDSSGSNKPDGSLTRVTDAAEQIMQGTAPDRIDLIYSHAHYDHIGGSTRFFTFMSAEYPQAKINIFGTAETRQMIRRSKSKRAPEPTILVGREGKTIRLTEGLKIKLEIIGGHSGRDFAIHIPKYKEEPGVIMYIDVIFPRWGPFTSLAITNSVFRYERAHRRVLEFDFDVFIGGHLRIGDKQDVMDNLKFTEDLLEAGEKGLSSVTTEDLVSGGIGDVSDPSSPAFGNAWFATVSVVRKLQIDACFRIMIEKWGCRLGGLDVVLRSHCFLAVTQSLVEG